MDVGGDNKEDDDCEVLLMMKMKMMTKVMMAVVAVVMAMTVKITVMIISVMMNILTERTGRWKGHLLMERSLSLALRLVLRRKKCC